jgi:hypothetical protein
MIFAQALISPNGPAAQPLYAVTHFDSLPAVHLHERLPLIDPEIDTITPPGDRSPVSDSPMQGLLFLISLQREFPDVFWAYEANLPSVQSIQHH